MDASLSSTRFNTTFSLEGKVAVITGAGAGIGKAIAQLFAERGASLVLVDKSGAVDALQKELEARGGQALAIVADIAVRENIERLHQQVLDRFGKVDILVNNAGIARIESATDASDESWDLTMAINLKAPFMLSQIFGKGMIERGYGKIVNMASQAGVVALDKHAAYCASKAGIIGLTKVLALEWARHGVNVNSISPTVVLTELGRTVWTGEVGEAMKQKIPAGRFGYPEEIAGVALFLASDAADLIHGENLVIDGGYTIQ
jgi:NAD(P)-dependent dehydrogenase (short-subunit alcohol dehydrogenase family)